MPRMLEKSELIKRMTEARQFDRFWTDTLHPSGGRMCVSFPDSLSEYDVQVIYIPVAKKAEPMTAKDRLHALMARTPRRIEAPYDFRRVDAYEEELA